MTSDDVTALRMWAAMFALSFIGWAAVIAWWLA
ncbi:hypothetical protein C7451_106112 [Blastomonas natatoria]|uniref:Uncharacterized protein n=1 Tax=Blastomonas natatoria TaxID=34015 RepID=A0A2V3V5D7_9SPHN|nr:hypothetical protein C7451_106112 [Blastomonas natatoria]